LVNHKEQIAPAADTYKLIFRTYYLGDYIPQDSNLQNILFALGLETKGKAGRSGTKVYSRDGWPYGSKKRQEERSSCLFQLR